MEKNLSNQPSRQEHDACGSYEVDRIVTLRITHSSPPNQLWHYTNADGLLGILETKTVWATDASYLNDRKEILYAKDLIEGILTTLCDHPSFNPEFKITPDEKEILDVEYRDLLNQIPVVSDVFVASFSTKFDDLSQWREYGNYSICVSGNALNLCAQQAGGFLAPCIYEQPKQARLVTSQVERVMRSYRKHLNKRKLYDGLIYDLLCKIGPLMKHPSFIGESEWRIVVPPQSVDRNSLKFRQTNSVVTPYINVDIEGALGHREDRPVTPQFGIGPGNDRLSISTMQHLTENMLGFKAFIHRSDTPYAPPTSE